MSVRLAKLVRDFYKRSGASQQARLFDLKYVGFGRYATKKENKIVAISENGKLKWVGVKPKKMNEKNSK